MKALQPSFCLLEITIKKAKIVKGRLAFYNVSNVHFFVTHLAYVLPEYFK